MSKTHRKNTKIDPLQLQGLIYNKPMPESWRRAIEAKGLTAVARVLDRYHVLTGCNVCGMLSKHKIFTIRTCQPRCPHCMETKLRLDAKDVGAVYLRQDPDDIMYSFYLAPCGHEIRRQPDRLRQVAAGKNELHCETCQELREKAEAEERGWVRIGPDTEGCPNYRIYQHGCGHRQRVARANMQTGRFNCEFCGESWSSAPSWLYLLELALPGYGAAVKLG